MTEQQSDLARTAADTDDAEVAAELAADPGSGQAVAGGEVASGDPGATDQALAETVEAPAAHDHIDVDVTDEVDPAALEIARDVSSDEPPA